MAIVQLRNLQLLVKRGLFMKRKIIITLSCLVTCLLLLIVGKTIWFYQAGGVSLSEIEKASVSNSQAQASQFQAFQYPDYPHYVFSLAENVGIGQPQELIVFEEKPLFFFKDTNRFAPTMAVGNEEDLDIIGSLYFTPKDANGNASQTDLLIYYSSNPCNISKCKYTIAIDKNSDTIEESIDPDDCFLLMIPLLHYLPIQSDFRANYKRKLLPEVLLT